MNYKILFCLLLVSVGSKKEFNTPIEKTKTLLGFSSESLKEDDISGYCSLKLKIYV